MIGSYSYKVNWEGRSAGFLIGSSQIGGTDKISFGFTPDFSGAYDDVTVDVKHASYRRGRANDLGPMDAGELTWDLKDVNADGSYRGRYNRQNPASPLVTANELRPLRPAKIEWVDSLSVVHPVAYGWLRTNTADASVTGKSATFEFIDLYDWLDSEFPVIEPTGPISVGGAFKVLLASLGWTNPAMLDLDDGPMLNDFSWNHDTTASGSEITVYHSVMPTETITDAATTLKSALDCSRDLIGVSLGAFFQSGGGVATFRARNSADWLAAYATLNGVQKEQLPGTDLTRVANRYTVTRLAADGSTLSTVMYVDDKSKQEFATRDGGSFQSSLVPDDAFAAALAAANVEATADPDSQEVLWGLSFVNDSDVNHLAAVDAELQKVVTTTDPVLAVTSDFVVESISGDIVPDGRGYGGKHEITMQLLIRAATKAFRIGASQIGGTDPIKFG